MSQLSSGMGIRRARVTWFAVISGRRSADTQAPYHAGTTDAAPCSRADSKASRAGPASQVSRRHPLRGTGLLHLGHAVRGHVGVVGQALEVGVGALDPERVVVVGLLAVRRVDVDVP